LDAFRKSERKQREDSSFALVVCAHDKGEILDGHEQRQSPNDEGKDSENPFGVRDPVVEALAESVKWRGSNIAIHHAESAESDAERTFIVVLHRMNGASVSFTKRNRPFRSFWERENSPRDLCSGIWSSELMQTEVT